jgi:hypothetical protein
MIQYRSLSFFNRASGSFSLRITCFFCSSFCVVKKSKFAIERSSLIWNIDNSEIAI